MEALLFIIALIALDIASLRWGADSRDGFNSPEWIRRRHWRVTYPASPHN